MFGWIHRAWQWAVGAVGDPVASFVRDMIHGVFGFLHTIFGHVIDAWPDLWHMFRNVWHEIDKFGTWVGHLFRYLYHVWIPQIVRWIRRLITQVIHDLMALYHWAVREFARFRHWVAALFDAFRYWVINNIWKPLYKSLLAAWHWIDHEGSVLWFYITHPAKLVDLIWEALIERLERDAWSLGHRLGTFFFALIYHNLKRAVLLAEDILNSVL